jgi:flagellar FliL protein
MAGKEATARAPTMSEPSPDTDAEEGEGGAPAPKGLLGRLKRLSRLQLLLMAAPVVVIVGLSGAVLSGMLDPVLISVGLMAEPGGSAYQGPPVYVELPDMIVNLDVPSGQIRLLRASISLQLQSPDDKALIKDLMPRILDILQTRLRALTPDDLKGNAQTYRLREELLQRVRVAVGPEHVRAVLFRDLLVR